MREIKAKYEKLVLGFGSLTERVYLGKVNPKRTNEWIGEKKDITSNFISVMLQKFEPKTETTITIDGKKKYTVLVMPVGEIRDLHPDTEADGLVFCGKCGKSK